MKNNFINISKGVKLLLIILAVGLNTNCELRPELPQSGSIPDLTPPTAAFTYLRDAEDFRVVQFTNLSTESTNYLWNFGTDGVACAMVDGGLVCGSESTSTAIDPIAKFAAGEGVYDVELTALDDNQASDMTVVAINVVDEFVPLPVTVLNGDFEEGNANWKIDFSNGWDNNAFESSSDGSWLKYVGTDNGGKTRGAKWNATRSVGSLAYSNTRVAYQPLVVSPSSEARTVKYVLEFEYALKDDVATDPPEGRVIYADVIAGHYTDGWEAYQQTDNGGGTSLLHFVASEVKGKTSFTTVTAEFTAPESGLISIMLSAITPVDVYVDNVKVYPAN